MAQTKGIETEMIIIGGSAGSLSVLLYIFPRLKKDFNIPIVVVLHRTATNDNILVQLLADKTKLQVKEVDEKEIPQEGYAYIAPPDYHLLLEKDHSFSLDYSEKVNYSRPSIDVTFQSAAEVYEGKLICVLLSGANADGAQGLVSVRKKKGITIVQNPSSAEVTYMPEQAILMQQPDHVLSPQEICDFLNQL